MSVKRVFSIFLVIATLFATTVFSGCNSKTETDGYFQSSNNGLNHVGNSNVSTENNGANQTYYEPYMGDWETIGYPEGRITLSFMGNTIVVGYPDENGEDDGAFLSYEVSSDKNYTYLELFDPLDDESIFNNTVLVLIDDDVMAICSSNLEEVIPTDYSGTQPYDEHIGITPTGTRFYGGECGLLVRPGTVQSKLPSRVDLNELAELFAEQNVAYIFDASTLKNVSCLFYPDCNVLLVGEYGVVVYVMGNGDLIYVEAFGINHLNGYQHDDIFTDSNIVITDNR